MWTIEKVIKKGDYNYALVRGHPFATKNGYVLLHRVVVENAIGRLLTKEEIVHHKNEDKKDNNIDNLEILSAKEHGRHHFKTGRCYVEIVCGCGTIFQREKRNSHVGKGSKKAFTSCSPRCRNMFSRALTLGRIKLPIGRVLREYIYRSE